MDADINASRIPTDPDDELLEELVAECLEKLQIDGPDAVDAVVARHPRLAEEIRAALAFGSDIGLVGDDVSGASEMPDRLGEFRLLERIGAGGMGVVFRAEQGELGRHVAVKMIRPELSFMPAARERFRREALAVSQLQHPGIVPVLTAGESRGIPWIAMELVEGQPLSALLERRAAGANPEDDGWEERCVRYIRQAAEALEHAHAREIAHRDVKPSNIMVTDTDRAQLLDFGLARQESSHRMTQTGAAPGSLPYMAPERLREDPELDASRADIYALGVTLFECLSLRLPYEAPGPEGVRSLILDARFPSLRALNPRVTWEMETACAVAMDPDPARRYASAGDFARDLGCILAGRPIEARRPTWWLRVQRHVRRHPARAAAMALAFGLFVIAPLLFARQQIEDNRRIDEQRARAVRAAELSLETVVLMVDVLETTDPWTWAHRIQDPDALEDRIRRIMSDLDENDTATASLAQRLAQAANFLGNKVLAKELGRRELRIRRALGDDVRTAEALRALAGYHWLPRDIEPVTALLREATGLVSTLGERHPVRVGVELKWMLLHLVTADLDEAEEAARELLDVVGDSGGGPHIVNARARAFMMLGTVALRRRDHAAAESAIRRSIEIRRAAHHHPLAIAESVAIHAHVLVRLKRDAEALAGIQEASNDLEGLLDPRHPGFRRLRHLQGSILFRSGKRSEAEPMLRDALAAAEDGDDVPSDLLVEAIYSLGHLLWGKRDYTGAARAHRVAARLSRSTPAPNVNDTALNLFGFGRSLVRLERHDEALAPLQESIDLQPAWKKPGLYVGALAHYELGTVLEKLERHEDAAAAWWTAARGFAAHKASAKTAAGTGAKAASAFRAAKNPERAAAAARWTLDFARRNSFTLKTETRDTLEDIVEEGAPDG